MSPTDSPDDEPMFDPRITSYPWPMGILAGFLTFVAGYLVMAVVILSTAEFAAGATLQYKSKIVAYVYYNSQQIPLEHSPVRVLTWPYNYLTETSLSLPALVYYAVPVVVIVLASVLLARSMAGRDLEEYVLPAMALTAGYLPAALIARTVFTTTIGGGGQTATVAPDLVQTVLFGLLYPLVCGLIGALAVGTYRNKDERQA